MPPHLFNGENKCFLLEFRGLKDIFIFIENNNISHSLKTKMKIFVCTAWAGSVHHPHSWKDSNWKEMANYLSQVSYKQLRPGTSTPPASREIHMLFNLRICCRKRGQERMAMFQVSEDESLGCASPSQGPWLRAGQDSRVGHSKVKVNLFREIQVP